MATMHQCQAEYDAMAPYESPHAHQREYLDLCFDEAEAKLRFLFKSIDTFERHVPGEHQDQADTRARLNSLCELIEDRLGDYGGRLHDPLTALEALVGKLKQPLALAIAVNGHCFVGTIKGDNWQPAGSGLKPLIAVNDAARKYESNGAGDNGL